MSNHIDKINGNITGFRRNDFDRKFDLTGFGYTKASNELTTGGSTIGGGGGVGGLGVVFKLFTFLFK